MTVNPTLLRRVLWFDALSGLGMAALFLIAGGLVAELTGLPRGLLAATGIALVVIAGGILLIATRDPLPRKAVPWPGRGAAPGPVGEARIAAARRPAPPPRRSRPGR